LKTQGKHAINIHVDVRAKATLTRIYKDKSMTMAQAVEWTLEQAVRLDAMEYASGPSCIPGRYQKPISEKMKDARLAAGFFQRYDGLVTGMF
jgi:hypothetical protein